MPIKKAKKILSKVVDSIQKKYHPKSYAERQRRIKEDEERWERIRKNREKSAPTITRGLSVEEPTKKEDSNLEKWRKFLFTKRK